MARVLVIGNVNADEVVHLDAPPTPGAHLSGRPAGLRLGGGGANAAVALAQAGHTVALWAAVGDDEAGRMVLAACRAHGLDVAGVRVRAGATTNRPLVLVDPAGERTLIARRTLGPDVLPCPATADAGRWDGVLVKAPTPALAAFLAAQTARGPVVALDPPAGDAPCPATLWVTSEREAGALAGPGDPWAVVRDRGGPALRWLVVTRGAAGAEALGPHGARVAVPAVPVARIVDATGAGDVFAAGLVHGLLAGGADIAAVLSGAAAWAARAVQAEGSVPPPVVSSNGVPGADSPPARGGTWGAGHA
ncbi:carbohydrate kinase family protein [Roseospira goensis]|uniref:Sugar/nucleoside kinase (Ribokinase family) n=1 Tax=Roseospira goensis TaxID=391922 RepID=A0A7W6RXW9_9PROT|nr:carbohydrate kinase family protein [Roseospira goensis]MBB4285275.1 sugar/nucleoside kinase (ribokinase family) [Roseospira goensis]